MAIVQISKIQQRSGNLVDLPQLDEAEFGWASDAKLLYIGKTTPNENVEVLTSYSHISFSQLDGSVGNLNISDATVANGQVLAFDGTNWVNKGGDAGGLITLGSVSNVKITGGAIGYVLETDGTGNLSWTPKGTISASILTITNANPGVVTTTTNNLFTDGLKVTITDARGMTQLNGNTYYTDVLSSNTFALYTDASLSTPLNTSAFTPYAYTSVSNTYSSNNALKVGNSSSFTVNYPVKFVGDMTGTNLGNTATYYVKTIPSSTAITVSAELLPNGVAGNVVVLANATVTANVYETGGRILSSLVSSGGGGGNAAGSTTSVQYNAGGLLGGSSDFTFDNSTKIATINGNINTSNVNASNSVTASRFVSTVATGTAPLTVTSTTLVPNLYVARANISDLNTVSVQSTGIYYPTFVNGNTTSNYALGSNSALSFNSATGVLTASGLAATANLSANNLAISNLATVGANLTVTGSTTAQRFISTIATGTAPLSVISTTRVSNLNVDYANVSDFGKVTAVTSGVYYPTLVNGSASANYALSANAALSVNVATGVLTASGLTTSGNVSANNISISTIANVGANLNVTGDTSLTGRLTTTGNVAFTGSNVSLGSVSNVKLSGGINGYVLTTDGTGNLSFSNPGAVVASPAGTNTQIQFNDNGTMGANAGLAFNKTTGMLTVSGNISAGALITANTFVVGNTANVGANLNVTGNTNVTANANVTGALNVTGQGTFAANVSANNLSIGNLATIGSNLTVSGAANIGTTLRATGSANLGNLDTPGYVTAIGNVTGGNLVTTRTVSAGNLSVSNNANVGGALTVSGNVSLSGANVSLGSIGNLTVTGGSSGFVLVTDGTGNLSFSNPVTIGTQPAGANTQVQFNDGGSLGAVSTFTFTKTTNNLYSGGNITAASGLYGTLLSTTGNGTVGGNLSVGANAFITLSANVGGALDVGGAANLKSNLVVAGNITSSTGRFIGNGSTLTSLTGANVTGYVPLADYATNAGWSVEAGNVTTNAQPNITSVGTLTSLNSGAAVFTSTSTSPSVDAATPNSGTTGGIRIRANSSTNTAILQFTDKPASAEWGSLSVTSSGNATWSGNFRSSGTFYGSGAGLTNLPAGSIVGTVANATYATSAGSATTAGFAASAGTANVNYITTNTNLYMVGVTGASPGATLYDQIGVFTNASTGILYATGFSGSGAGLTGTASSLTAGSASYATTAGTVNSITSSQVTTALGYTPVSSSSFPSVQGTDGYCTLPNGLKMVWGRGGYVGQDQAINVTFAYPFSTACLNVQVTPLASSINNAGGGENSVYNISASGFTYYHGQDTGAYPMYFAIGY